MTARTDAERKERMMFDWTLGRVVRYAEKNRDSINSRRDMYGHVIGFDQSDYGETTIRVKWQDGETLTVHPGNLALA